MINMLPKAELEQLKVSGKFQELAANPQLHVHPEVAIILAKDEGSYVRRNIAENPALADPPDVVRILAEDEEYLQAGHVTQRKKNG